MVLEPFQSGNFLKVKAGVGAGAEKNNFSSATEENMCKSWHRYVLGCLEEAEAGPDTERWRCRAESTSSVDHHPSKFARTKFHEAAGSLKRGKRFGFVVR
jgi:hypothetical protein